MFFYSRDMFRQGRVDSGITPEVVTTSDISTCSCRYQSPLRYPVNVFKTGLCYLNNWGQCISTHLTCSDRDE